MSNQFDDLDCDEFADSSVAVAEPPSFDLKSWEQRGINFSKAHTNMRWEIGDWMVDGKKGLGEMPGDPSNVYAYAENITAMARGTLRDLASTADRCRTSVRADELSWSHHRVVVNEIPKADDATLKRWLKRAVEETMSVATLKASIRQEAWPKPKPRKTKSMLVRVPPIIWEALKDMAADPPDEDEAIDQTVQEYAAKKLIKFVESDEGAKTLSFAKNRSTERRRKQRQKSGRRLQRNYPGRHFG
jgi:hypothetical protein